MNIVLASRFFEDSNYIEAGLWIVIGVCFAIRAIAKAAFRNDCVIAAITFVVFGFSDIVEASTGAWWRPWWLFVWKAVCVAIFLYLFISYYRWKRRNQLDQASQPR